MTKRIISLLAVLAVISPDYGLTHGGVTRASLLKDTDIRLFIADNMDSTVVTVDFPSGEIINRVTVPPSIMILAESNTKKYIYAMRGRDTDQGRDAKKEKEKISDQRINYRIHQTMFAKTM